jgi:mitochondrial distribution and morphology protein 31
VNISHIQSLSSTGNPPPASPISWIKSGKVDVVLDFRFPHEPSTDIDLPTILSELATNISTAAIGQQGKVETRGIKGDQSGRVLGQKELARPALVAPSYGDDDSPLKVTVDIDLRFRDVKAAVPLWKSELSYSNSALIRPIVAFMKYVVVQFSSFQWIIKAIVLIEH